MTRRYLLAFLVAALPSIGVAFTLKTPELRNDMLKSLRENRMLALASGERSVRFRLPFIVSRSEIDTALERVTRSVPAKVRA